MPIPIKYKCLRCGGESDQANQNCISCQYETYVKYVLKEPIKHFPRI